MADRSGLAFDEMVDGSGGVRPGFRFIVETVFALGPELLQERTRSLARASIEEAAASLLASGQPNGWQGDPLPLPLARAEHDRLVQGLSQRADLIEAALQDLYGEQTILEAGLMSPSVVFDSRWFLRSRHTGDRHRSRFLSFYAADLVRLPDGRWRVAADQTSKPGGIQAAVENRRLLRRVMPELFVREVCSLDGFFEIWREQLLRAARDGSGRGRDAGLALLTEGHLDPFWFEHVLLARTLGCDLVQGGDLTLRGGTLFLKTLRGLKQVDVLLNRQHPRLLDPLELDWDDHAGVPGLMSALRAGRVAVLNDPGCGLAEIPGFMAAVPGIAARLGVELMLPQLNTIWLGNEAARNDVLAHAASYRFRSSSDADAPSVRFATLGAHGRQRLLEAIARDPDAFVSSEFACASTLPCVDDRSLVPMPFSLRMFLVHDGQAWNAFTGGFVRVLGEDEDPASRLPRQGRSKDVLLLPPDTDRIEHSAQGSFRFERSVPLVIHRIGGDLPARVAEDFFLLGRVLEQLEMRARLSRALSIRLTSFRHRPRELVSLRILAACLGPTRLVDAEHLIDPTASGLVDALSRLGLLAGGLAQTVRDLGYRIELLHDRITSEMHLVLSHLLAHTLDGFAVGGEGSLDGLAHATGRMLGLAAALNGFAAESMVRDGGRTFLELGLRLTRAETICRELGAALGPANDLHSGGIGVGPDLETALALVLELRDSSITYRGRYFARLELAPVLDLVIADPSNPRALCSQFAAMVTVLDRLGELGGELLGSRARSLLERGQLLAGAAAPGSEMMDAAGLAAEFTALGGETSFLRRMIARRFLDLLPEMRAIGS